MNALVSKIRTIFWVITHADILFRNNFQMLVSYDKDETNRIAELCDTYGSDKGSLNPARRPYRWTAHTYADFYNMLLFSRRESVRKVFECGVGRETTLIAEDGTTVLGKPGASLRMWRDYFPNARVIGADINTDVLFEEERIQTYALDQTSPADIARFWKDADMQDIDLIVDDGLHTYDAGVCLFENSIQYLADDGYYIIEDMHVRDVRKFQQYFKNKNDYAVSYVMLTRVDHRYGDNNLLVIRKKETKK